MVVGALHLIGPLSVRHLQIVFDFLSGEAHGVEHVLVAVEVEHVAHVDVALGQ